MQWDIGGFLELIAFSLSSICSWQCRFLSDSACRQTCHPDTRTSIQINLRWARKQGWLRLLVIGRRHHDWVHVLVNAGGADIAGTAAMKSNWIL